MGNSSWLKTYLTTLYVRLYKSPGIIIAIPFVAAAAVQGGVFSAWDYIFVLLVYLLTAFQAISDDEEKIARLTKNYDTHTRRNEIIFYSLFFVAYTMIFVLHRGAFQGVISPAYFVGAILFVAIYFLRPGSFRLK